MRSRVGDDGEEKKKVIRRRSGEKFPECQD
jgi:hypothetical protein